MKKVATLREVQQYFEMTPSEIKASWAALNDQEKTYFKEAVGQIIHG